MVAERIGQPPEIFGYGPEGRRLFAALGVVRSGVLLGGAVFHNFKGATIELSAAFDRADWVRPSTLRRLYSYPFIDLKCANLLTITKRSNTRARQMDEFMGFKVVGPIIDAFGEEDAILYQMPRKFCRWIKER
jgi:hypothetical protein